MRSGNCMVRLPAFFASRRRVVDTWMAMKTKDDWTTIVDKHYSIDCPHCGAHSNLTAVSIPRYEQLVRYSPVQVVIGYRCDSCNAPVALRFNVVSDFGNSRV